MSCEEAIIMDKEQKKISLLIIGKSVHPYWQEVEVGIKSAADKYKVEVEFYLPPREEVKLQIETIEKGINRGVQGIAFATSYPMEIKGAIDKAISRGIPAITINTDAPTTSRYLYVGTNNYLAGKIAGDSMSNLIGRRGKVAIVTGSLSAQDSQDRIQGFKDALSKHPEVEIVTTVCDEEDFFKALNLSSEILKTHSDLKGFFGVFASDGPAIANAVIGAHKMGEVKIVCFDLLPDTVKFINQEVIHCAIGQRPYMIGYRSVEILYQMAKYGIEDTLRGIPPSKIIDTGVDVVTKENLNSYRDFLKKLGIPIKF